MKAHELLKVARPLIETLLNNGVSPKDVLHLDMYMDYIRLKGEGHKITYIEAYLSEQYEITDRHLKRIVSNMNKDLKHT